MAFKYDIFLLKINPQEMVCQYLKVTKILDKSFIRLMTDSHSIKLGSKLISFTSKTKTYKLYCFVSKILSLTRLCHLKQIFQYYILKVEVIFSVWDSLNIKQMIIKTGSFYELNVITQAQWLSGCYNRMITLSELCLIFNKGQLQET